MPLSTTRWRLFALLGASWLLTGHAFYLPRTITLWGGTRALEIPRPLAIVLVTIAVCACALVFVRRFAIVGASLLAVSIGALAVVSESYFANYRVFVLALLAVALIAPPDPRERALRLQCALVYAGAALDKLLDPAFRDGRVVSALLRSVATNGPVWAPGHLVSTTHPIGAVLAPHAASIAPALALLVIALEVLLVAGYLARSRATLPLAVLLHVGIYLATGSTFGVFFHAAIAAAFVLTGDDSRRAFGAALAFSVYASTPLARPELVALASPLFCGVAMRRSDATKSRTGPS